MNELTTFRWSFEEDVQRYAEAGFQGIGVWRQKLSDYGEEKGIRLMLDCGLQVSCLSWAGGFTGSDGRTYRESVEDAREGVRLAAAMQADCLVVYSGARGGHTQKHARRLVRSAMEELLPLAGDLEVALAVEPMHDGCADDWTFLTSVDETMSLLNALDTPWAKMVFDTYHLAFDPEVLSRIPDIAPHVALLQVGDARRPPAGEQNRCSLGSGVLPLSDVIQAMRSHGYDGYCEIELLGEDVEDASYGDLLRDSRETFETLLA